MIHMTIITNGLRRTLCRLSEGRWTRDIEAVTCAACVSAYWYSDPEESK